MGNWGTYEVMFTYMCKRCWLKNKTKKGSLKTEKGANSLDTSCSSVIK